MQKKVMVKNRYDKNLSAIIEMPDQNIKEFMIVSHCFTCSKIYKLYNNISNFLVSKGYGVVRYDASGLGDSEGDFSETSFNTNIEDLISIYTYISENYKTPSYLFGHSLGSLVSIKAANMLESIKGVITIGSPSNFDNLIRIFSKYEEQLQSEDSRNVKLAGRNIDLGMDYLEDIRDESVERIIKDFDREIIIFHSDNDTIVPYDHGLKLFNLIASNKSFITLKGVDHLVGQEEDARYIGELLYTWLENIK